MKSIILSPSGYGVFGHFINYDLTAFFLTETADITKPCGFKYMGKLYTYNEYFRDLMVKANVPFSANPSSVLENTIPFKIWTKYINS